METNGKQSKAQLAAHITEWHGRTRVALPLRELYQWRRDDLDKVHRELHDDMAADSATARPPNGR